MIKKVIKEAIRCNQEAIRGPLTESAEKPAAVRAVAACARSAKWKKGRGAPGSALLASPWALLRRRASSGRAHGELMASSGRAQGTQWHQSVAHSGTRWHSAALGGNHLMAPSSI